MSAAAPDPQPTVLDQDTALTDRGDGLFEGVVTDRWTTPRGPLGGYVMAIVLRALILAVGDGGRQVRSLTVNFVRSPAPGPVMVRTAIERVGRSLTTAGARLEQDGKLQALALASFSTPWSAPELTGLEAPAVPGPDADEAVARVPGTPMPSFRERLSMQPRFGDPPFSGSDRAEVGGWLALNEEREIDPLSVVVLADAWFPAPWPRLSELMPAPTIELSVYFRSPLPLPSAPLLGRFRSGLVRDGFFDEDGELWSADGTLVAQSRQIALLIAPR